MPRRSVGQPHLEWTGSLVGGAFGPGRTRRAALGAVPRHNRAAGPAIGDPLTVTVMLDNGNSTLINQIWAPEDFVGITIDGDIPTCRAIAIATGEYHRIDVTATGRPRKFNTIALPTRATDGVAFAVGLRVTTDHAGVTTAWTVRWIPCTTVKWNLDGVAHEGGIGTAATILFVAVVD